MLLVADSGSTKAHWIAENNNRYETIGLNPLFHSSEFMLEELHKNTELKSAKNEVSQIFYYGTSCSSDERKAIVYKALKDFFQNAQIHVGHDMEASAFATYVGRPTISCILGTGSNSCLFDGNEYSEVVPSLGYILGDEGSGSAFGKQILIDFLYHKSPKATAQLLSEKYELTKEKIFEAVYKKPNANVFLASFAKVLDESSDKEYMNELKKQGIRLFFQAHVLCYPNYQNYPVSFVGSIAFYLEDT
ncbi:MAG TPA: hypothetical protein VGB95_02575, partial [Chitinophagales bacterium]